MIAEEGKETSHVPASLPRSRGRKGQGGKQPGERPGALLARGAAF
ncbi:Hypothetical protein AA314_06880 [Archangium gephyra]|uniref:Uncharacterized protein n=1 Tax=Archangium gephyra TaxID=48 RepID=A0AAC8QD75_9BACT|nr:Hypothetical protein AA314_06880 [Archangium gephyra]